MKTLAEIEKRLAELETVISDTGGLSETQYAEWQELHRLAEQLLKD